ncbi:Uma2 family endonuclease [Crossiella sp. CA-258035]|uniref:Uma2 family endonuclease n=1 Tax=Crossiella sp. CA-258035 TaxID=2981138 RepID=UPI0024BD4BC6|nr:Uma2 family endonuclease [Crossiella sp. CA-258035]WHT21721.1 Uma2 family endonuclease [Crossiella sp. CA-258035]
MDIVDGMAALPDWMHPPREEGWYADDLDSLPEAPRHTELIDGALVFMMSPQRAWHARMVSGLRARLAEQAPDGVQVFHEMTIRLDKRNRPEPDIVATTAPVDDDSTWFSPADVLLAVEVVSPESEHRDRTVKFRKYAEAGIPHYWVVEQEGKAPLVRTYELDMPAGRYAPAGIFRGTLERPVPFPITLDLSKV